MRWFHHIVVVAAFPLALTFWPAATYLLWYAYRPAVVFALLAVIWAAYGPHGPFLRAASRTAFRHTAAWLPSVRYIGDGPPVPTDTRERTICLLFPHGMVSSEQCAVMADVVRGRPDPSVHTLLVDRLLYRWMTPLVAAVRLLGGSARVVPLVHASVQRSLTTAPGGCTVFVMPGGFVEAVGYSDACQVLYVRTVSYWLQQCRRHGYRLCVYHAYNGSRAVRQHGFAMGIRTRVAERFHLPLVLPTGFRDVPEVVVRAWAYPVTGLPVCATTVVGDLLRYARTDRTHPLYPSECTGTTTRVAWRVAGGQ